MSWVIVGVAAASMAKSQFIDQPAADRQRKLASETQRYSPWTHMQAGPVKDADIVDAGIQGAGLGGSIANGMQQNELTAAKTKYLNNGGSMPSGQVVASTTPTDSSNTGYFGKNYSNFGY